MISPGTNKKRRRSTTGQTYRQRAFRIPTRIRLVEVKVNYMQDGELGAVSVIGDDYEIARDQAFELVPEDAERLSIMVDREQ